MKVFVSSLIRGFEDFRSAAVRAAQTLKHQVSRAEDFGASADTPQRVCLAGVRGADVVILILGARYGDPQGDSDLSPTHEEYREAREGGSVLVFIQEGVEREPRQAALVTEVQEWSRGQFTAGFRTADDLRDAVTSALHEFEILRRTGDVDEAALLARAQGHLPDRRGSSSPALCVVLVGAPEQQVLRPAQLEAQALTDAIQKEALFGDSRVFDQKEGSEVEVDGDQLVISQDNASVMVTQRGDVRVVQPAQRERDGHNFLPVLIQEEIKESIERALLFSDWLLDTVDPKRRLAWVAPVATIIHSGYTGWMTRNQRTSSGNSVTMGTGGKEAVSVHLSPAILSRPSLRPEASVIAEDLMVLLRREIKR